MEHMSRERISMEQRLKQIRENCGVVSSDNGVITVCSYTWILSVNARSALACMGVSDFKKMIRVVKSQLDPDYFYEYMTIWQYQIQLYRDDLLRVAREQPEPSDRKNLISKALERMVKHLTFIHKMIDQLPAYVFEE